MSSTQWLQIGDGEAAVYIHSSLAAQIIPPTATQTINTSATTMYYVNSTGRVNIRACAATTCEVISAADRGEAIRVVDREGDWLRLVLSGNRIGYISASLTSRTKPAPLPTAAPTRRQPPNQPPSGQQSQPVSTAVPAIQPPAGPQFSCNCSKTCEQMASCQEAYFQLNQCGCSRHDGVPCESICPGG